MKIPNPWKPSRLNRTGKARPAFMRLKTGGSSTGWKNPVKFQITLTVAVSVAVRPPSSVTRTATVRVAGARRLWPRR